MCRVFGRHKVKQSVVCSVKSVEQRQSVLASVHVAQFVLQTHSVNVHRGVTHEHALHHVQVQEPIGQSAVHDLTQR